ncbi:MAG: DUF305 domain-containing protein [Dermatophilaceae bacterium]
MMKLSKKARSVAVVAGLVSALAVGAVAYADPPPGKGGGKPPKDPVPTTTTTTTAPTPPPETVNTADSEFVAMMIPHHFQATLMSQLAPERSGDQTLQAFAERIDVEQSVEIGMMQNWQTWNDLEVTDAEMAYEMMLGMPMHVEHMGMATAEEMDALAASSGTDFDRMYLELMIDHHEGAVDMLVDVLTNGSDTTLQFWATDMLTAQSVQIDQMEQMLAALG